MSKAKKVVKRYFIQGFIGLENKNFTDEVLGKGVKEKVCFCFYEVDEPEGEIKTEMAINKEWGFFWCGDEITPEDFKQSVQVYVDIFPKIDYNRRSNYTIEVDEVLFKTLTNSIEIIKEKKSNDKFTKLNDIKFRCLGIIEYLRHFIE